MLREIERSLGRDEDHRSGPRTIDLDILFYGERVINEPGLDRAPSAPAPAPLRAHALERARAALGRIPSRLRSVNQMLAETSDPTEVRLLFPQPSTRYGSRPACSPRLDS